MVPQNRINPPALLRLAATGRHQGRRRKAHFAAPQELHHPRPIPMFEINRRLRFHLHTRLRPDIKEALCTLAPGVYLVIMSARGKSSTFADKLFDPGRQRRVGQVLISRFELRASGGGA